MKISKLDFSKLRNGTHFQFHSDCNALFQKFDAATLDISPELTSYTALWQQEDDALLIATKSEKSELIVAADALRDEGIAALNSGIGMYKKSRAADKLAAAERLAALTAKYKNLANIPLNEQTGQTVQLLQDMELPINKAAITLLGLAEWVAQIQEGNAAVMTLMAERYEEQSLKETGAMIAIRKQVDAAYRLLTDRLEVNARRKPADFKACIDELNARISYYNTTLNKKAGKADAQTESPNKD